MKLHNVSLELIIDSGTHIRISWEKQDKTRSRKNTRGKTKQNREKKIRKWKLARKGNRGVYLCTCVLFPWKHVFFSPDCTEFVAAHWQFPRADSLSLSLSTSLPTLLSLQNHIAMASRRIVSAFVLDLRTLFSFFLAAISIFAVILDIWEFLLFSVHVILIVVLRIDISKLLYFL